MGATNQWVGVTIQDAIIGITVCAFLLTLFIWMIVSDIKYEKEHGSKE